LVVFIVVQNLVEIGILGLLYASFNAMRVWLENAYLLSFDGVFGGKK